ncbi:MAG: ADP-ribosylglycohydrolase family protein [Oligosphaeraceae bacterium]
MKESQRLHEIYAGVLGKVIGVYLGRPVEGMTKEAIQKEVGFIDHYVARERGVPLVVADDDISGTFTFVRALEDSGLGVETSPVFFGETWLNYILEHLTILWWGGMGMSTENTAFLRLKAGIHSPESGSMKRNGKCVSEQIGGQIFIDGFGLVCPGRPGLAARLARMAAGVSHDGEAVHAAVVVAAMVSAAFTIKKMDRLLDIGVSFIPQDSLIAQVHRDVRQWCREDGDWEVTMGRIQEKYGYQRFGGGVHVVPNHALMVMAWCYGKDSFRKALAISVSAGWDTDCNGGNVGTVMGVLLGLDKICEEYDFRTPFADQVYIPTAEGTHSNTDCWRIARHMGRILDLLEDRAPAKPGAWLDFAAPGAVHGFRAAASDRKGDKVSLANPRGAGLEIDAEAKSGDAKAEVVMELAAPAVRELPACSYRSMSVSPLYPGLQVTAAFQADLPCVITPYITVMNHKGEDSRICGEPQKELSKVVFTVPEGDCLCVRQLGFLLEFPGAAKGRAVLHSVEAGGEFRHAFPCLPSDAALYPGWILNADVVTDSFSDEKEALCHLCSNGERRYAVTGGMWWGNQSIQSHIRLHGAEVAGLVTCYQGTRKYLSLTIRQGTLVLAQEFYGETILAKAPLPWGSEEARELRLECRDGVAVGYVDGKEALRSSSIALEMAGGAGYLVQTGNAGFGQTLLSGSCQVF